MVKRKWNVTVLPESVTVTALSNSATLTTVWNGDNDLDGEYSVVQFIHIVYGHVLPVVVAIGIVGNILSLLTFTRGKFTAPTYIYFKCLAVSDTMAILVWVPYIIINGFHIESFTYVEAFYYAHLRHYFYLSSISVGACLLIAITIDRYIAINHPTKFKQWITNRRTVAVAICCFTFSYTLFIPYISVLFTTKPMVNYRSSYIKQSEDKYYMSIVNWVYVSEYTFKYVYRMAVILPVLLMQHISIIVLTVHSVIGFRKMESRRIMSLQLSRCGKQGTYRCKLFSKEKRTVRTIRRIIILMVSAAIFNISCLAPAVIISLIPFIHLNAVLFGYFLIVCNSAFNFYIYLISSKYFRKQFLLQLRSLKLLPQILSIYSDNYL